MEREFKFTTRDPKNPDYTINWVLLVPEEKDLHPNFLQHCKDTEKLVNSYFWVPQQTFHIGHVFEEVAHVDNTASYLFMASESTIFVFDSVRCEKMWFIHANGAQTCEDIAKLFMPYLSGDRELIPVNFEKEY